MPAAKTVKNGKTHRLPTGMKPHPIDADDARPGETPLERKRRQHTAIYLPDSLRQRLGQYALDKHKGRLNMRNQIILDALDQYLRGEGY